jgi:hypothetical protein
MVSVLYGDGTASLENGSHTGDFKITVGESLDDHFSVKFVYYNEGRVRNHDRDGFGGLVAYRFPLFLNLSGEVEAGPMLTFDTTRKIEQTDDKHFGVLTSFGLIYPLYRRVVSLRVEYDHLFVSTFDSDACLVGLEFTGGNYSPPAKNLYSINYLYSHYITNHTKSTSANGFQVDVNRKINDQWSASAAFIYEGDDGLAYRPFGIAGRLWRDFRLTKNFRISAGIGPYVAENRDKRGASAFNGLISMRAGYQLNDWWSGVFDFSRVADFGGNIDADVFSFGFSYNLI